MDNKAALAQQIYEAEVNAKNAKAEGEAIGIEKEKIQIAKRLLQAGYGIDLIVQATILPREQVESLKGKKLFVA
jgi:predicted transposase YdaD